MAVAALAQARHSHHITEEEVLSAQDLAEKGEQRLRHFVHGEPNIFSFNVPLHYGRAASVEFHVAPVICDLARHTLYAVTGSYTPSHDDIHPDQVFGIAQLVYDTYIRVTWLRLDSDILERRPSTLSPPSACLQLALDHSRKRLASESNVGDETPGTKRLRNEVASSDTDGQSENSPETDRPLDVSGLEAGASVKSARHQAKLRSIANTLAKKILKGQKKRMEREKMGKEIQKITVQLAVSDCLSQPVDDERFDACLDRVEQALQSAVQTDKSDANKNTWITWFFLSCLRLVREQRRSGRKHLPSRGAKIANLIVNHLFVSDGVAAMGVYDALAEHCYKARRASELHSQDIEYVSFLAANELRGRILRPISPGIPCPGVWLTALFQKVPYYEICDDIGLPNLACLRMEPEWCLLSGRRVVAMAVQTSLVGDKWDSFISGNPDLQGICDQIKSGAVEASAHFSKAVFHIARGNLHQPSLSHENRTGNTPPQVHGEACSQVSNIAMMFWDDQQISDLDDILQCMEWPERCIEVEH